jgi:hypothetical protein
VRAERRRTGWRDRPLRGGETDEAAAGERRARLGQHQPGRAVVADDLARVELDVVANHDRQLVDDDRLADERPEGLTSVERPRAAARGRGEERNRERRTSHRAM